MNCIVTGSAGFLGSHLVDALIARGHSVIGVDNLSVGRTKNHQHHYQNDAPFSFFKADVNDCELAFMERPEVDWVFHLGARADIVPSIEEPDEYYRSNVSGTFKMVELARKYKVKRFIYAASSSCYGIPDSYPTPETAEIRPQYPYALTKRLGEEIVLHWAKVFDLPAVSLRFFNLYGPRARTSGTYGAVMGTFVAQLVNRKPMTVVGDGTQTRDFTFVSDAVSALIAAAESDKVGEVYNVGSGGTYSIMCLVELLGGKEIEWLEKRPGEPDCTFADIRKIKEELGWSPQVSFEEGVKKILRVKCSFKAAPVWTKQLIDSATGAWFKYLKK